MKVRIIAGISAALLVVTLGACDSGRNSWGSGSNYSVEGALAQLPAADPDAAVMIQTGDLVAASEQSGLERPEELDGEALVAWLGPLTGISGEDGPVPVFVPVASLFNVARLQDHQQFADELGWSILDAEAFVEQSTPPQTFTVVAGDFDESSLSSDLPEVSEGVVTAGDGEDQEPDVNDITIARPVGMPLRLAQQGHLIAASPITDEVVAWADEPEESLADRADLSAVAAALDDADVVAAVLVAGTSMALADTLGQSSPEQLAAAEARLGPMLPADPFETVGIGWAADGDRSVMTAAYYFDSADAAEAAVPVFEQLFADGDMLTSGQPLSSILTLDEARAEGQVAVLTLAVPEGQLPATILRVLMNQDIPFVHR